MRATKLTLTALVLTAGLSLTACQGDGDSAASTTNNSGASTASSSAGTSDSDSADSSAPGDGKSTGAGNGSTTATSAQGSGNGQINTGPCKTANLAFDTAHGMGEGDLLVSLKNTGDACTLKGFPGVDLRSEDASGPLSAKRSEVDAPLVNLGNGETTRFTLHYPSAEGSGAYVSAIEITPPDETHSKALPVSLRLQVSDGADQKVVVDPVGTGKQ
ncbi:MULTISPECIES: DUF4232 domain-containing protein [Streptomyces]|uniref:DUF4232 domain-containing protein n=1 Tax=Streptomyces glycanivorans TaxID=3033808 RepID=A0ABY9JG95_9ACTN|nr:MULTISPECIES: DUF4232 domain-containing protein [unclassified Streptomyces]WSQ80174.1 DUF4232 domain-containing protein [Streptomyces sp. NBC_01213]TXS08774.1 DUF4232 domain-containing protein [Streptomyces sp. wa22]WLQ66757.1 DUF4232 domain-containing protein [Streptomyces sp. Alt3]WSQ87506.1 DUF4232 domain-containing protein [Streptomyces sp. NBC_01212]WSR06483.1 DUF4232 domain-containing protein [Streptomyces sp. NBC_01208]